MAITIISKNSTVASKRPTAANLVAGELGLNLESTDPGLYYEDSAGNIRKVGGCSYSATAPNATPAGQTGNSVGELWYDTGAASLKTWDGTAWVGVGASAFDWQSAAGAPVVTTRSDASPLVDGDLYWDTTGNALYGWDAATTAWVPIGSSGQFDWQTAAGAPTVTVRSDGSALVDGDQYWDQTANILYGWDAATTAWAVLAGRPWVTSSDTAPASPNPADLWYDSINGRTYIWYDDGTSQQWIDASPNAGLAKFDWQSAAGDPTTTNPTTLRSDGTALAEGDQYWDTTANQLYAYDLALTSWGSVGSGGLTVSATAPVGPTEGDLWYNENDSRTYAAVNDLGGTAVWVDASPDGQRALITTSDNAPALPTEDDLWWNSTDGRMYVYYNDGTSTQWVETSPVRQPANGFRNVLINGQLLINQRGLDVATEAVGNYGQDRWKVTAGGMTQIVEDGNYVPSISYTLSYAGLATPITATSPASGDWDITTTHGDVIPTTARSIQMEAGAVATDYELKPIGTELALCQRYYETRQLVVIPVCHGPKA